MILIRNVITHLLLLIVLPAWAQLKMEISMDKEQYLPGETIQFKCRIPAWEGSDRIATLNLWIENSTHEFQWKLRYPILTGLSEGELVLPDSFPKGIYAFYFQMQDEFWGLKGSFDEDYYSKTVDYTLLLDNKDLVSGEASVAKDGTFHLPRHVFPGQAKLFFTEVKRKKYVYDEINITIKTPLDSGFVAVADSFVFRRIGEPGVGDSLTDYVMDLGVFGNKKGGTLANVDIVARKKTRVEEFEDAFISGMFRSPDAYTLSNLDNQIGAYFSIIDYMVGRIPGFRANRRPPGLEYEISIRGETPSFFLDEIPVFQETISIVPVNDIALVKVFRTPLVRSYVGGSGAVISVYTKRGGSIGGVRYKNTFPVNGYTPLVFKLLP